MSDNPNRAVIDRFVASVFSGDSATLLSLCAPDFVLHEGSGLSFGGSYPGGEGFLSFLGLFGETLEIARLEPIRTYLTDDPDWIVCEFELEATVKATGKAFASSLLERWRFRDGKVVEIKPHYFNAM
ncbi:MAG: nuclear transport factor 2 family protein [Sphingomonadales bacterium]|nr:nuclear transport factor 2 family protein [Sphingomonadales bacterium]